MDKKRLFFNLLYVLLIVGLLAFMFWMVLWLKGSGFQCLQDPINYYTEKTAQVCYCNNGSGFF